MKNKASIDFNYLLQLLNGMIMIGIIFYFNKIAENIYVDNYVILASIIIHIQIS